MHAISKKQQLSAQVLSKDLGNLRGEKWLDIADFEGLYQISNYGRVKSLARYIPYKGRTDAFSLRKERILQLRTGQVKQAGSKREIALQVKLHKENIRYYFSVSRLVYYHFTSHFDLSDHSRVVSHKDEDPLNCHYRNLQLRLISEVVREGYSQHRRTSLFQLQSKPVNQYGHNGIWIKSFSSVKEASVITGILGHYISDAANREERLCGGYYWRYGKSKAKINVSMFKNRRQHYLKSRKRPVQKLSLKGKVLRTYNSVLDAARSLGRDNGANISAACNGKAKSSLGYRWRYVN
jgi:hypothetical protein